LPSLSDPGRCAGTGNGNLRPQTYQLADVFIPQIFPEYPHEADPVLGAWGVSVNTTGTGPALRELPFYWGDEATT